MVKLNLCSLIYDLILNLCDTGFDVGYLIDTKYEILAVFFLPIDPLTMLGFGPMR